jgi:hypothetical protein
MDTAGVKEVLVNREPPRTEAVSGGLRFSIELPFEGHGGSVLVEAWDARSNRSEKRVTIDKAVSAILEERPAPAGAGPLPARAASTMQWQPIACQEPVPPSGRLAAAAAARPLVPAGAPSAPGQVWTPSRLRQQWVLCIGAGRFSDRSVPPLPYARKDAQAICDWFLNPHGPRVPRENVRVLLDEQATRENVKRQLSWIMKNAMPEDLVVVYFAGHGAPALEPAGTGMEARYLVLYDTDTSDRNALFATALPLDELGKDLDTAKAETQVVILECCYAGPVGKKVLDVAMAEGLEIRPRFLDVRPRGLEGMGAASGRIVLSASTGSQVALSSARLRGGLFTHYLLRVLGDGRRPLVEGCFDRVWDLVRREASKLGSWQEPQRFGDLNLDVVFAAPGADHAMR